jgi:hypothetical protein
MRRFDPKEGAYYWDKKPDNYQAKEGPTLPPKYDYDIELEHDKWVKANAPRLREQHVGGCFGKLWEQPLAQKYIQDYYSNKPKLDRELT